VEAAGGSGPAVRGSRTDVIVDLSPDEIREVQRVLVERGFSVEIDGRLGPRTRQALIQFQRREGLQATGRIDNRTITSLGVSVRSNQSGSGQQPSTTGRGNSGQGSGAAQQPSQSNQGVDQPQRSPSGQQGDRSGAGQQDKQSDAQKQNPSPTTGQGSGASQNQPANQGSGAGQGANNPAAKQAPSSGGTAGSSSMPSGQQQQK
jgi:peptidoglycan hydrolase-like protein with peptidoglycan-binding domain